MATSFQIYLVKEIRKAWKLLPEEVLQKLTRSSVPKTIITTVVDDSQKQKVLDILVENAKSGDGEIGDGKIFITKVEEAIRVRTSESGKEAL